MKTYTTKNIRNIVLIGAPRSGKTTLSEAMLFEGKLIDRRGSVEEKNTVSDNTEFEQTNQKSINATPLYAEFNGCKINFIDAPGSDDFSGGALSAFKVVDAAVMVMNGTAGIEVGTTLFARYADQYGVPMMIAVNQLDHDKANWEGVRNALNYGDSAPQVISYPRTPESAGFFTNAWNYDVISEDCLRLNVWTPGLDNTKRPVIVWLHGGGFSSGNAIEQDGYGGENLARYGDVVFCSVNHRLNCFGYSDFASVGGEKYKHSGNVGMLDIVAALQWIHDNITQFGGDPGNVTVIG